MGSYSFKSVGKTQVDTASETLVTAPTPVGIRTPMALGDKEGILKMSYSLADQVGDNLRNLLMTNWGEHVGLYDMGANLRPLMSEFTTQEDFDTSAVGRIKDAAARWMPYVELEDFISVVDRTENKNTAVIKITITYNVPALQLSGQKLQIVLYAL